MREIEQLKEGKMIVRGNSKGRLGSAYHGESERREKSNENMNGRGID